MCNALLPLKLLVDADAWQIRGKTKLMFYIFPPPVQKTLPRHWASGGTRAESQALGAHQHILLSHLKYVFTHKFRPKYA